MKHNEQDDMYTHPHNSNPSRRDGSPYELEGWVEEPFPTSNLKPLGNAYTPPSRTPERKMPVWASLAVWCGEVE